MKVAVFDESRAAHDTALGIKIEGKKWSTFRTTIHLDVRQEHYGNVREDDSDSGGPFCVDETSGENVRDGSVRDELLGDCLGDVFSGLFLYSRELSVPTINKVLVRFPAQVLNREYANIWVPYTRCENAQLNCKIVRAF